ncbi:MAG: hypothetical protein EOP06_04570 [Proteobacteria bacterium]|nr:MAG: hypothetical protein EOP06_04570 [Pseudomonadota bacterium]
MSDLAVKKKAVYICFEGTEGVGKTTQVKELARILESRGLKVLSTKEPGSPHQPLTVELRAFVLDAKYADGMTALGREMITQTIRAIHLEKLIAPALNQYDVIIQDRGIVSGFAYGRSFGHSAALLKNFMKMLLKLMPEDRREPKSVYDVVVRLKGSVSSGLKRAQACKQEYASGDFVEGQGVRYMNKVTKQMDKIQAEFNTEEILVDGKSIEEVSREVLNTIEKYFK